MRTQIVAWMLTALCVAQVSVASDVGYELETESLKSVQEQSDGETPRIQLQDRVWAAPGVEQAHSKLPPRRTFGFQSEQRFRIEGMPGDGPEWVDDIAWPRTRELFGRSIEEPFYCGGIVLAR
jgi:hypothetical protein